MKPFLFEDKRLEHEVINGQDFDVGQGFVGWEGMGSFVTILKGGHTKC